MGRYFFSERQWFVLGAEGRGPLSARGRIMPPNPCHMAIVQSTFQLVEELGKWLFLANEQAKLAHYRM